MKRGSVKLVDGMEVFLDGKPTESDLEEVKKYGNFLKIRSEAEEFGLSKADALRYASIEAFEKEITK